MNARLEAAAPQPRDLTPADAFAAWALNGRPGDVCAYHHGLLGVDRDPVVSRLGAPARQALTAVADLALAFAEAGRVLLVQERLGSSVYRYLAVIASKHSKQAARPMSRPVVLIPQVRSGAMPIAEEEPA
jgi:hypothetical protein